MYSSAGPITFLFAIACSMPASAAGPNEMMLVDSLGTIIGRVSQYEASPPRVEVMISVQRNRLVLVAADDHQFYTPKGWIATVWYSSSNCSGAADISYSQPTTPLFDIGAVMEPGATLYLPTLAPHLSQTERYSFRTTADGTGACTQDTGEVITGQELRRVQLLSLYTPPFHLEPAK
jgi:hypothetical protein